MRLLSSFVNYYIFLEYPADGSKKIAKVSTKVADTFRRNAGMGLGPEGGSGQSKDAKAPFFTEDAGVKHRTRTRCGASERRLPVE